MTTKLFASDPLYSKINFLQTVMLAAVNKAPFSPYENMPEVERQAAITSILDEQEKELLNAKKRSVNFVN